MCGEKAHQSIPTVGKRGSPPRVRGKAIAGDPVIARPRITPACAGKRSVGQARRAAHKDHPRVCGEKNHVVSAVIAFVGSPPRVRGKVPQGQQFMRAWRITPACAGKRLVGLVSWQSKEDHPRVCGEKPRRRWAQSLPLGSPPRVRGKGCAAPSMLFLCRITPACAGKR